MAAGRRIAIQFRMQRPLEFSHQRLERRRMTNSPEADSGEREGRGFRRTGPGTLTAVREIPRVRRNDRREVLPAPAWKAQVPIGRSIEPVYQSRPDPVSVSSPS